MSLSSRLKKLERAAADPSRKYCACPGHKEPECRWIKLGDPEPEPEYCPDCGKQRNLKVYAFCYSEAVGPVPEPESDE